MADVVKRNSVIALCEGFALNCRAEGHSTESLDDLLYYATGEAAARAIIEGVKHLKAADVRPVVLCRDCMYAPSGTDGGENQGFGLEWPHDEWPEDNPCPCKCDDGWYSHKPAPDFFCAAGEKREKE